MVHCIHIGECYLKVLNLSDKVSLTKQFLQMAALLCTESESKTKMLRNCGINPKPRLILSWLKYII